MRKWIRPLGCLTLAGLLAGCELAAEQTTTKPDKPGTDKPTEAAKSATHKVEKGPFKVEVTLKGVFEAEKMNEVSLHPEAWSPLSGGMLVLKKVLEHGTPVRKGDPVLWLDTEKLDQTIKDLENDRQLAELAIKQAEDELPLLEKAAPFETAAVERAKRIADEDLKRFVEVDRAFYEKGAEHMLKSATQYVEYAKEELKQLEKMYRSKDLTEETEEIILKRQRNAVASAEFYLKLAQKDHEETLKIDIPRKDQSLHENALKLALSLEKLRATMPTTLSQKRLTLARMKYDREKTTERLAKLKRDRESMTVTSPVDGLVYHGKCVRGQWQSGLGDRLRRGAPLQADEVLITIVQPKPLRVRAEVEEKDLQYLTGGLKAKVSPVTAPDVKLVAKVDKVSLVPVAAGKFDTRFNVEVGGDYPALMPGMACTIKLVPYVKEQALTVPASAVFSEELDDDQHYVLRVGKDGKPSKQTVQVGKRVDRKAEILEGLKEGDEILLDKPGEKKSETPRKEATK